MGSIPIKLGASEWHNDLKGWDCHLLQLSHTKIADVRLPDGTQVSSDSFRSEPNISGGLLQWTGPNDRPYKITVVIEIETEVMNRASKVMKLMKIIVPVIVAIIMTAGGIGTAYLQRCSDDLEEQHKIEIDKLKQQYQSRIDKLEAQIENPKKKLQPASIGGLSTINNGACTGTGNSTVNCQKGEFNVGVTNN